MTLADAITLIETEGMTLEPLKLRVRRPDGSALDLTAEPRVALLLLAHYQSAELSGRRPAQAPESPVQALALPPESPTARAAAARLLSWREHLPGISVRLWNILNYAGVQTIGDIEKLGGKALLKVPHCGATSVREARTLLAEHGITLSHG